MEGVGVPKIVRTAKTPKNVAKSTLHKEGRRRSKVKVRRREPSRLRRLKGLAKRIAEVILCHRLVVAMVSDGNLEVRLSVAWGRICAKARKKRQQIATNQTDEPESNRAAENT